MAGSNGPAGAWTSGLQPVPVADILVALSRRWNAISIEYPAAGSRSASVNLVTYANDVAASAAVSTLVGDLAATHPIRAITVIEDDAAAEDIVESYILVGAIVGPDGKPTCSEEIFLRGHPGAAERIVSAVYGVLVADLPVYLWWRGPSPFGNPLFKLVAPFAHKIIVDSMRFGDTGAALDTVRRMAEHREGHVAVADLNWKRTRPWRQVVAACFDDPRTLGLLPHFDRCEITFASGGSALVPQTARAALFAGWLTSRVPRLHGRTRVIPAKTPGETAGRIESVLFSTSKSKAALSLRRTQEPVGIDALARGEDGSEIRRWTFATETLPEAELLHHCLDDPSHDPVFEAALAQG